MKHHCLFCNHISVPVHVHGHYQCAACHTNILPCCDSDNCETNFLLLPAEEDKRVIHSDNLTAYLQSVGLKKP